MELSAKQYSAQEVIDIVNQQVELHVKAETERQAGLFHLAKKEIDVLKAELACAEKVFYERMAARRKKLEWTDADMIEFADKFSSLIQGVDAEHFLQSFKKDKNFLMTYKPKSYNHYKVMCSILDKKEVAEWDSVVSQEDIDKLAELGLLKMLCEKTENK